MTNQLEINKQEPDYEHILSLDALTVEEISRIAYGGALTFDLRDIFSRLFPSKAYALLKGGVKGGKIKRTKCDNGIIYASPLECFKYLKDKGFKLPTLLDLLIIDTKRSPETYIPEDVRGDKKTLKAVCQTLLDLFPELPKEEIIKLKPVQTYANGVAHSDDTLKDIITDIEGRRRSGGAPNKNKLAAVRAQIPSHWRS
ncbi:MAG TPA: hypothetical protein DCE71_01505 [Parachlamydiales bacterium]|nr:hypothetical protein [Parachlamydiales bacterium]